MLPMAATVRAARPVWGEQVIDGTMVAGVDLGAHRNPEDRLTAFDLHLHGEGTHYETYNTLGAHLVAKTGGHQ